MAQVCGCQLVSSAIDVEAMRRTVEDLSFPTTVTVVENALDGGHFDLDEEQALMRMFLIAQEAVDRFSANVNLTLRLGDMIAGDTHYAVIAAAASQDNAIRCTEFLLAGLRSIVE